jgi:hypothetical protein
MSACHAPEKQSVDSERLLVLISLCSDADIELFIIQGFCHDQRMVNSIYYAFTCQHLEDPKISKL